MNIKLPVLQKNDSWEVLQEKAVEENFELFVAIEDLNATPVTEDKLLHVAEEALDNIEVNIGILDKLGKEITEKANLLHIKKLLERGWHFKSVLEIRED